MNLWKFKMEKLLLSSSSNLINGDDLSSSLSMLNSEAVSQANAIMKLKRYKLMQKLKKETAAGLSQDSLDARKLGSNPNAPVFVGSRTTVNDRLRLPKLDRVFESASNESLKASSIKKKRVTEPATGASNQQQDSCKTPNPCNQFYAKCIDDVEKCNDPKKMKLIAPRELRYVQNLPYLKYTAFGCGKSIDCLWQIETRPTAKLSLFWSSILKVSLLLKFSFLLKSLRNQ